MSIFKTVEEARAYRYNQWSGNPRGTAYDPKCCAGERFANHLSYQCARKPGHGPSKLYCKRHAKRVEAHLEALVANSRWVESH